MTKDRLDELLARHLAGNASEDMASKDMASKDMASDTKASDTKASDILAAARVMAALAQPLPRQHTGKWNRWPGILLDWQFAPAWPRLAALACCAALGFAAGIAGLDQRLGGPSAPFSVAAATDLSALVFEPEPLTGLRP